MSGYNSYYILIRDTEIPIRIKLASPPVLQLVTVLPIDLDSKSCIFIYCFYVLKAH